MGLAFASSGPRMPTAFLDDRTLVAVSGPDAEHLLQNVITTDLDKLEAGEARPGALLTPQGKVMFDFLVSRAPEASLLLECRAAIADELVRRLSIYRLRAKATISKLDPVLVRISWQTDSSESAPGLRDLRFPAAAGVTRCYTAAREGEDLPDLWQAFRISHGVPESGLDYQLGEAFPHDVLLDQTGGVGFRKGCYVGQEVVSRMQHRGSARRRALIVAGQPALPPGGTEIKAGGRVLGTLGSTSGGTGIAIVRIDRLSEALAVGTPVLAGDVPVDLSIPPWAGFSLPPPDEPGREP